MPHPLKSLLRNFPRLQFLLKYYLTLVGIFILSKPLFMLAGEGGGLGDYLSVMWYGLPLDLATTGYLSAVPWLVLMVSVWVKIPRLRMGYKVYCGIVALLLSLILLANIGLYEYWGIPLDAIVFVYLDSPANALASVSVGFLIVMLLAWMVLGTGIYWCLARLYPKGWALKQMEEDVSSRDDYKLFPRLLISRPVRTFYFLITGGLLFLGIRGGVGKSTANPGMVYFSTNQYLNHAAVNPAFNLLYTWMRTEDYAEIHNFFPEEKRAEIFARLGYNTKSENIPQLLTSQRPNILIILMEGCGGTFVNAVDSQADASVTPNINALAREGVFFSNCYANSFRTDRGVVCTLSGYPAFPGSRETVMRMPAKWNHLPSIAKTLRRAGYATEFLYGGDVDFTNTRGYLIATGYERAYGDKDFPASARGTHNWGVTDHIAFDRLFEMIKAYPTDKPWHTTFLTLSSHEPWEVPYDRIKDDKKANSMAYLDDCVGKFIGRFRQMPQWKNTLVVLVPDHGVEYPAGMGESNSRRSHIPVIWTGGVVEKPYVVEALCNQTDLAATLLGQLALPHDDFRFSRDVLSSTYVYPSAVHMWIGGFFFKDNTGLTSISLATDPQTITGATTNPTQTRLDNANAFLQTAYDDLGAL